MKRYAKTKTGLIGIIWSDNDLTMDLIPENDWIDEYGNYDSECFTVINISYEDILVTDSNLIIVRSK